ncbi:hypothetical protein KL86DPRO_70065 [uncultured delta proteobacterium]|uniref:Methyltransferase type 11 domain-containing protein n=1 Tax=uncultured delta proteobacterium TaxID=34034 RepID=A0A212KGJ2_9DELT|nr:hypothetical protein KL86DPRO_70065 [uncultured delta proteobacterium]
MAESPYKNSSLYDARTISVPAEAIADGPSYMDRLLYDRVSAVRKYRVHGGTVVDIGCATGEALRVFDGFAVKIGVDFSQRYLVEASQRNKAKGSTGYFVTGDVTALPLADQICDVVYSFSTLYYITDVLGTYRNIFRILRPGGVAVLDVGNIQSLNAICCRRYKIDDGYAALECPRINDTLSALLESGFEILEHRSFQLLPLWAAKPRLLWPLLHPKWNSLMKIRIMGKMIDEWISSLPGLKRFAFRHLVVCRRPKPFGG